MDNLRGAALMMLSMLGFAIEDMFIKMIGTALPVGEILMILGLGGAIIFGSVVRLRGEPIVTRAFLSGPILLRGIGEVVGTIAFVSAFILTSLSAASAILQATPLVVTLGAALFLGETVGWRRWTAIGVGFIGVMLIIQPGTSGFSPLSILAVIAVFGLALRDLATRKTPATISSMQLSFLGFSVLVPAGALLLLATGGAFIWPGAREWVLLAASLFIGVFAYYGIVAAMRVGEVSFVTPFRYVRIIFALIFGVTVFGESPNRLVLLGAAIIVASGIYTVWRERHLGRGPLSKSAPAR